MQIYCVCSLLSLQPKPFRTRFLSLLRGRRWQRGEAAGVALLRERAAARSRIACPCPGFSHQVTFTQTPVHANGRGELGVPGAPGQGQRRHRQSHTAAVSHWGSILKHTGWEEEIRPAQNFAFLKSNYCIGEFSFSSTWPACLASASLRNLHQATN